MLNLIYYLNGTEISFKEALFYEYRNADFLNFSEDIHPFFLLNSILVGSFGNVFYLGVIAVLFFITSVLHIRYNSQNFLFSTLWPLIFLSFFYIGSHLLIYAYLIGQYFVFEKNRFFDRGKRKFYKIFFLLPFISLITLIYLPFIFLPLILGLFLLEKKATVHLLKISLLACFFWFLISMARENSLKESFDHFVLSLYSFFSDPLSKFSYQEAALPIPIGMCITFLTYWIFSFYFKLKQSRRKKSLLKNLFKEKILIHFLVITLVFGVFFYINLDGIFILAILLVLVFWDHQNYFKESQKKGLFLILFLILFSGFYTVEPPTEERKYLRLDQDCSKRHWILSVEDTQHFNLPKERVKSISFIDLKMIPYNLNSLLGSQTMSKNLNVQELIFLSSERKYALAKLEQMKKRKCIGIYIRRSKAPLRETPPFSRARIFYDALEETTLILQE